VSTPQPEVRAWERQDGEPEDAWAAFEKYRDMASPRRIEYAAIGVIRRVTLFDWASTWRWQERATAYDRHTDGVRLAQREELLKQDETERTAAAIAMLAGAEDLFTRELKKLLAESEASDMSIAKINDLTKLMNSIITMRRLVHGESTENVAHTSDFDLSKLSLDELRAWRELQAKIEKE
jgi:hypothetical protein